VLQYAVDIGLVSRRPALSAYMSEGAALAGDLVKLQWLYKNVGGSITMVMSQGAASSGSIEILKWLAEVSKDTVVVDETVMTAACANGQVQTVQYLFNVGCPLWERPCFAEAAKGGHLRLLKWMVVIEPFNRDMQWRYGMIIIIIVMQQRVVV
jgi:hypothetical protein